MKPYPKPKKRKKVKVDWTGFAIPKTEVRLEGHAYKKFKDEVIARDGYRCKNCGNKFKRNELTLQHKIKRSIIRLDTKENCDTWCIVCHMTERETV